MILSNITLLKAQAGSVPPAVLEKRYFNVKKETLNGGKEIG